LAIGAIVTLAGTFYHLWLDQHAVPTAGRLEAYSSST
jgi:hypothetical protein